MHTDTDTDPSVYAYWCLIEIKFDIGETKG